MFRYSRDPPPPYALMQMGRDNRFIISGGFLLHDKRIHIYTYNKSGIEVHTW